MGEERVFFLIAGESSGDRLGSALMRGLSEESDVPVVFVGVGGPMMAAEGLNSLFEMDELSVMGIGEVLPKIPKLLRRISETTEAVLRLKPTALITIDSPDFNFRVAKRVKEQNSEIPVVHYVAPSVWAWRPKRAAKMSAFVDHVLALLPFEPPYMHAEGMSCDFVGHPITSEDQPNDTQVQNFRENFNLEPTTTLLTVLPGSRSSEVTRLAPVFRELVVRLRQDFPDLRVVIPSVGARVAYLTEVFAGVDVDILDPRGKPAEVAEMDKRACFASSKAALAASGTVSLELAAAQTPMVIAYQMHWITAIIKKRMVRVSSATLVNLLTKSHAVPEFLLEECTAEKIYPAIRALLADDAARDEQRIALINAIEILQPDESELGNPAARSVMNFLKQK